MSKTNEEFARETCETYYKLDKPRQLAFMTFFADMACKCPMRKDAEYLEAAMKAPEEKLDEMIALQYARIKKA